MVQRQHFLLWCSCPWQRELHLPLSWNIQYRSLLNCPLLTPTSKRVMEMFWNSTDSSIQSGWGIVFCSSNLRCMCYSVQTCSTHMKWLGKPVRRHWLKCHQPAEDTQLYLFVLFISVTISQLFQCLPDEEQLSKAVTWQDGGRKREELWRTDFFSALCCLHLPIHRDLHQFATPQFHWTHQLDFWRLIKPQQRQMRTCTSGWSEDCPKVETLATVIHEFMTSSLSYCKSYLEIKPPNCSNLYKMQQPPLIYLAADSTANTSA